MSAALFRLHVRDRILPTITMNTGANLKDALRHVYKKCYKLRRIEKKGFNRLSKFSVRKIYPSITEFPFASISEKPNK